MKSDGYDGDVTAPEFVAAHSTAVHIKLSGGKKGQLQQLPGTILVWSQKLTKTGRSKKAAAVEERSEANREISRRVAEFQMLASSFPGDLLTSALKGVPQEQIKATIEFLTNESLKAQLQEMISASV